MQHPSRAQVRLRRSGWARATLAAALVAAAFGSACSGDDGGQVSGDASGDVLPPDATTIVDASAEAMGAVTSVRFGLLREGAPAYIDPAEALRLDEVDGRFAAPRRADALVTVTVAGSLTTQLGAVAVDDEVWLSNPITGDFEVLPEGYDLDPSLFFDPEDGWQPLLEDLTDIELVGLVDRNGERYHIRGIAPGERIGVVTAGLVDDDVIIDLWIHPVTALVSAAEMTVATSEGDTDWTLELRDYGADFEIEPPELDG